MEPEEGTWLGRQEGPINWAVRLPFSKWVSLSHSPSSGCWAELIFSTHPSPFSLKATVYPQHVIVLGAYYVFVLVSADTVVKKMNLLPHEA